MSSMVVLSHRSTRERFFDCPRLDNDDDDDEKGVSYPKLSFPFCGGFAIGHAKAIVAAALVWSHNEQRKRNIFLPF